MRYITEIVYEWPDGRTEVRYRCVQGTPDSHNMERMVRELQERCGASSCPFTYRHTPVEKTPLKPSSNKWRFSIGEDTWISGIVFWSEISACWEATGMPDDTEHACPATGDSQAHAVANHILSRLG